MRIPRIHQSIELTAGTTVSLDTQASVHVSRVLRLKENNYIIVFNGQGGEYLGVIRKIDRRSVTIELESFDGREAESPLNIVLLQGLSRSDRMDFTVQKTVELGVSRIQPVVMQFSSVNADAERLAKKQQHWQGIVSSACEQCGRNRVPQVEPVDKLENVLANIGAEEGVTKIVMHGGTEQATQDLGFATSNSIYLLVGPEGGISEDELVVLKQHDFKFVRLGPRVMRTETAAVAMISLLQYTSGDLN